MHLEKGKNIEKLTAGNLAENYTYLAGKRSIKSIEKNGFKFKSDTKKAVEKALNEKFDSVEYHKVHWKQGESYFECIGFHGSVDSYEGRGGICVCVNSSAMRGASLKGIIEALIRLSPKNKSPNPNKIIPI